MVPIAPVLACVVLGLPPTVPLAGVVVDAEGKPVEAADVWLAGLPWWNGTETLAHAQTDGRGRFSLDRPADAAGRGPSLPVALWAYRPGHRLGLKAFPGRLPGADEPVRVALGPPARTVVRVLGPDGKSLPGARVRLTLANLRPGRPPAPLLDRIEAEADAEGRATLDGLRPEDVLWLDVKVKGLVDQAHAFPPSPESKTLQVRPVGTIAGRLVADDPAAVRGWTVAADSRPDEPNDGGPGTNWADEKTDDRGRFRLDPLAAGRISFTLTPPKDSPYRAVSPPGAVLRGGDRVEVEIPLKRGIRVEGVVRDHDGGAPVPGVKVDVMGLGGQGLNEYPVTDAEGRYAAYMMPGQVRFSVLEVPKSHFHPQLYPQWLDFELKAGEERHVLPPVDLYKATAIRGTVLDAEGRPAAGVDVTGTWVAKDFGGPSTASRDTTDAAGAFTLGGIAPGSEVSLAAAAGSTAEAPTETATAGGDRPVTLRLRPREAEALRGRVLGPDGHPRADALVRIKARRPGEILSAGTEFAFADAEEVRTGADGTFRTPAELPKGQEYRAEFTAAGLEPGASPWVGGPGVALPDVTLRRAVAFRAVAGRVLDRQGRPVAGAEVFQAGDGPRPTRDATDDAGRFRVPGVPDGPAYLFARKEGFRFGGIAVKPGAGDVELVLGRADEPPPAPLKEIAGPLSRREERALARDLLAPIWARALASSDGLGRPLGYQVMALVDPARILEMMEDQAIPAHEAPLADLALGLHEEDPAAAIRTLDSARPSAMAGHALLNLVDFLPGLPAEARRDMIERAGRHAREVDEPSARARLQARVADRWLDLGEPGRATPPAREAQRLAELLPKESSSTAHGEVAVALARIDLPAALKLTDGRLTAQEMSHVRVQIATRIAATAPAEAERLIGLVGPNNRPDGAILTICGRMAVADLPRARRLADTLAGPTPAAVFPALAAQATAAADPHGARGLLEESFGRLERLAESGGTPGGLAPAVAMARLLPMAARLDPDRSAEDFWRTLAARPPADPGPAREPTMPQDRQALATRAQLATLLARYDRAAADATFAPVAARLPAMAAEPWGLANEGDPIFRAATAYDPRAALALFHALPEDPVTPTNPPPGTPRFEHHTKTTARPAIARMLALPPELRRREALRLSPYADPWPVDLRD